MADEDICPELVRLLKLQRHDFLNHMQVIHAMLQLGRGEKALNYIDNLAKNYGLVTDSLSVHAEIPSCKRKAK